MQSIGNAAKLVVWSSVVLATGIGVRSDAQGITPLNNSDLMYGSAEAPKIVQPGALILYVIKQVDSDTFQNNGTNPPTTFKQIDPLCIIEPALIQSMNGPYPTWSHRGSDGPTFTHTWDVSGLARTVTGIFVDTWRLKNSNSPNDPRYDPTVNNIQQQVIIQT